jgi:ATP-binding cassette subfamily D (ALD) protein 3
VAFYRGQNWEKNRINEAFKNLNEHSIKMMNLRLYMGMFDGLLVKYGSVMAGYAVMGLPVFGLNSKEYLKSIGGDKTAITRDYVRNSSLLINLAKAIGRMVLSYKEVQ